ncbi:histidine ammonia-lyase [Virgibacillus natechei]|uniref:Histidine ammonia-lyase n=1 Tax=Virgibacillus natechei TaxID=1216297 RepID=A0ABS4IFP5_9BACI|nr:histidine ammonia-lyase [Virgibacillus natechei]MBP1969760.1 histidine ammonia-lyase [Virgibacillus natechei]UZD12697.1 histidine ammonia-lyase [Virgibacillus natechei]
MVILGQTLTLNEVEQVVLEGEPVTLADEAVVNVQTNRNTVEAMLADKKTMYGINTGFGKFSDVIIEDKDLDELQLNLIHSHACGIGDPFSEKVSRAMLLLRANALLQGYSGIRPVLIDQLISFLNAGIHPVVPQQGSLGASGDLAPLSHLASGLLGEGEVVYKGNRISAMDALAEENIEPLVLKAKEGLALINGTQAMTAVGVILYLEMKKLLYQSEKIAAMTMEGLHGIIDAFDADVHQIRGHQEQIDVAERMRFHLQDSKLTTRQGEQRVQDAYSLRCIPQVLGASWQTALYVKEKLEIEMNAVTDNPLIFSEEHKIISGGNFHGQPIAFAMDFVKLGIAETANIAERRIERLVNPQLNDLPAFLSPNPGLESGAMIMQYSAASLVSENKTLAHPASVDSIPSSANQEDHVSMGTIAARHALQMLENTRHVVAIELICAMQAVEYRGVENMASATRGLYEKARDVVPSITKDRVFATDIERLVNWLKNNEGSELQR